MIKWLDTTGATSVTIGAATGDTMVFVTVSETYDLSTQANKMTLIGIHTPTRDIIQKTYPGLCMNSKYVKICKQDVAVACASAMPFSADTVGTDSGDIAPEDAFNPILYTACSNESMSNIEARLMGLEYGAVSTGSVSGPSVISDKAGVTGLADEFPVYYALLSNRHGFKTANPQQGLVMRNLVPLVFEKYYNNATNDSNTSADSFPVDQVDAQTQQHTIVSRTVSAMRGKAHPMPRFNTTYITGLGATVATGGMPNGMSNGTPQNGQAQMPDIMPVYTGLIIMPPSRLHTLYYRMVIRTTLEFTEVRPIQEIASFIALANDYAPFVYHSDYSIQSKIMDKIEGMADIKSGSIEKIMEGS